MIIGKSTLLPLATNLVFDLTDTSGYWGGENEKTLPQSDLLYFTDTFEDSIGVAFTGDAPDLTMTLSAGCPFLGIGPFEEGGSYNLNNYPPNQSNQIFITPNGIAIYSVEQDYANVVSVFSYFGQPYWPDSVTSYLDIFESVNNRGPEAQYQYESGTVEDRTSDKGLSLDGAYTELMDAPSTASVDKVLTAQEYCLQVSTGTASCSYGTATVGSPLQFTATAGSTTFTPTDCDLWNLTAGPYVHDMIAVGTTQTSSAGSTAGNGVSIPLTGETLMVGDGVELVDNNEFTDWVGGVPVGWEPYSFDEPDNLIEPVQDGVLMVTSTDDTTVGLSYEFELPVNGWIVVEFTVYNLNDDLQISGLSDGLTAGQHGIGLGEDGIIDIQSPGTYRYLVHNETDTGTTSMRFTVEGTVESDVGDGEGETNAVEKYASFGEVSVQQATSSAVYQSMATYCALDGLPDGSAVVQPAVCTVLNEMYIGFGSDDFADNSTINLASVNGLITFLRAYKTTALRSAASSDGTRTAYLDVEWDGNEVHKRVVQADGTNFRVGLRRFESDGITPITDWTWSLDVAFDGSFDPLDWLRFALYGVVPMYLRDNIVWGKVATEEELDDPMGSHAPADLTPNPFTFNDRTDEPTDTLTLSNSLTITGMDPGCPVSIAPPGEFEKNGSGTWTAEPATIDPGDSLRLRMTSSGNYNTTSSCTITVGTVSDTWTVTTEQEQVSSPPMFDADGNPMTDADGNPMTDADGEAT